MKFENIAMLMGGLALFLLGMNSMGNGLETACGSKMKSILKKLTSNRFIGVLVGALITAIIQSSSATTVMVLGFVNAGMMTLSQAIWVIMGANIGTTVTGLLIAVDVGVIAPIFAIIGIVMMLFIKKPTVNEIGKIFAGFGILFIGMNMMSESMMELRDNDAFKSMMTSFSNPILGILVGAIFTAVIQSSSASIGILQALAISGAIELKSAVFILFGQNIGTCITALLASIGTNRNAKRTTLIHFMFNIIGTVIFTILCLVTPLIDFMQNTFTGVDLQIAAMHTTFNFTTTIILLPFGLYLVKISEIILPDKKVENESIFQYLDNDINIKIGNNTLQKMGNTSLHIENVKHEIKRMYAISLENLKLSFEDFQNKNNDNRKKIIENEDLIDKLNDGIIKHITAYLPYETNVNINKAYGAYLTISNNIERIADHTMNLSDENFNIIDKELKFSAAVENEIAEIKKVIDIMVDRVFSKGTLEEVKGYENQIDDLTEKFRNNMLGRLTDSKCTAEGSISYSTLLINLERIGDHLLNISEQIQRV